MSENPIFPIDFYLQPPGENIYMGTGNARLPKDASKPITSPHIHYYCPHAGRIWAEIFCHYPTPYQGAKYYVQTRRCHDHDGGFLLPLWGMEILEIPREVKKNELLLYKLNEVPYLQQIQLTLREIR